MSRIVIFTDLNGTLLDQLSSSTEETRQLVRRVAQAGVPVVFCSSKTFEEQRLIQEDFGIEMPCILENGSAIAWPEAFWPDSPTGCRQIGAWRILELGLHFSEIQRRVRRIESEIGESLLGLRTMSTEDVASLTGLDFISARRAQQREYSETLALSKPEDFWQEIDEHFVKHGLACMQNGPLKTVVSAQCDKGTAVRTFMGIHNRNHEANDFLSVGIGDGPNDQELLVSTDVSYQVMGEGEVWEDVGAEDVVKVSGVGPAGWRSAIRSMMESEHTKMRLVV